MSKQEIIAALLIAPALITLPLGFDGRLSCDNRFVCTDIRSILLPQLADEPAEPIRRPNPYSFTSAAPSGTILHSGERLGIARVRIGSKVYSV